jgi:tetraacyldisaccharide-1-P 4'-kinase
VRGRRQSLLLFTRRSYLASPLAPDTGGNWGVLSGIARPESFENDCVQLAGHEPALIARFDDHHPYQSADVDRLLAAGRQAGVIAWLTTRKDWIKLAALWPTDIPLHVVELEIVWEGEKTLPDLVEERFKLAAQD